MSSSHAFAGTIFISYDSEESIKIIDLPHNELYQSLEGEHVDLGYVYKSVAVFFIPIWNYDGRLAGITAEKNTYIPLSPEDVTNMLLFAGLNLPKKPYLDFWQRVGGKIVFLLLISFFLFYFHMKTKKKDAYLSALSTANERLKDIIINGQGFNTVDLAALNTRDLDFIAVRDYLTSFLSVSIFNMNNVSIEQLKSNNDDFFKQLVPLKKRLSSNATVSTHYVYFVFERSPSIEDIAVLKALQKKKFRPAALLIPCIIDLQKKEVIIKAGSYPSKKAVENCFIQAEAENAA